MIPDVRPGVVLGRPLLLRSGARLSNRIAKASMSEKLAGRDGAPTERHIRLYRRWGEGGAGLLLTGNVMIDPDALEGTGNVIVCDERHLGALRRWAEAAQESGVPLWMQINHPGRHTPRSISPDPVAPSAVPLKGMFGLFSRPRALVEREIEALIARFARTASVAKRAGFSGVQIHAAHGYLAAQFLSPRTNRRTDRWGGSADNRRRFLLEVVRAVRAEVGRDFAVSVKLNSADFQRGGFNEEESIQVVEALDAEGIDLLEVSGGNYESVVMFAESPTAKPGSTRRREAFFLEYAEKVRSRAETPLMLTGGFRTAAGMTAAIAGGAVDVAGMARPFCLEPDLPARLLRGEVDAALAVRLKMRLRRFRGLLQGAWHEQQLKRLAEGLEPDPHLGSWKALMASFRASYAPRFLGGPF